MISPDGGRVVFLRTRSGTDRRTCLWQFDVHAGTATVIADPATLAHDDGGEVPAEERMRRERARESSGGIVRFSTNTDVTRAAFDLAGKIYVADLIAGGAIELPASGRAIDPRIDPTGTQVAYVEAGALHVVRTGGDGARVLMSPENDQVTYGLAEFVAAEEMGRQSGYWWSPDGSQLLVARVDVSRVLRWYIADPSNPATRPVSVAYPAAGTDNAEVTLHVVDVNGSATVDVRWDRVGFEYVATAGLVGTWVARGCAEPRSAHHADPRGGRVERRDIPVPRGHGRRLGRHRRGRAGEAAGRDTRLVG